MRAGGSPDDTWEDGDDAPADGGAPDRAALDAAAAWLAATRLSRLDIHMRAADPSRAEREMAFDAMAAELTTATGHVRDLMELARRLRAENTVLRRAAARQRADAPAGAPPGRE